jgi:hypothetical protein
VALQPFEAPMGPMRRIDWFDILLRDFVVVVVVAGY